MKSELKLAGPSWKITLTVGLFLTILVIFVAVWFRSEFSIILLSIAGGIAGLTVFRIGNGWQHYRIVRANANEAEARARMVDAEADEARARAEAARYVIETKFGLFHRVDDNKIFIPATANERRALLGSGDEIAETEPSPIDFFDAMLGTKQPYKILAEQRRGKSYLAMHITDRAAIERGACVVIGTKFEIGEWPNAVRFLVDPERVAYGLRKIIDEVVGRHQTHKRTPIIRVFLDDWINTVIQHQQLALEFLDLASTQMVSAGIVPYFLLQGDGNDDWGSRRSAMLKNNFSGLWVTGPRDGRGDPIPYLNTAVIRYPGSREEIPVRLPVGLPQLGISRLPEPRVVQPEQSEADALFIALVESGQSRDAASFEAYGKGYGGNSHVRRLKGLLGE